MGLTEIIKRNGEIITFNTQEPCCILKSATQNSSLMGDDYISLQIVSDKWLSFDKGDKIIVDGVDYTIRATTKREIQADKHYIFEPVFYGPMYELMKTLYRNTDKDGKSDRNTFDLTYTIKEFVQVIIYNLNRDYPGLWAFDETTCPETEAKTIQFSGINCLQALQSLCSKDNFNLEFRITQENGVRTIHIGKFGQRVNPPGGADFFEWGKGNGLYKLTEQKIDDKAIITRLWVEGGTSNIRTNYRNYSERLQLPYPRRYNRNKHTLFDGTIIEPYTELIGISDDNKRYLEDETLRDKIGSEEDVKTYDKIYPTRTGRVTALVSDDINAFIDNTMDFDLCEKDANGTKYLVDGVSAKITFTSGRLAGQQFELEAKGGYDHSTKKFKLIPFTDKRGLTTPTVSVEKGGAFPIEVNATYKITDIFLPESYEQNAEEELWYAGYNDFKPATQAKAQYSLTLDRLYFLEALSRDSKVCLFKVGDYVPVKDTRYGIEKQIRIQKITRNLLLEQDYQLTIADTTAISIQTQTVLTVLEHDKIITNNRLRDLNQARRGWRTTEDLRNMVYDTDGFFDVDKIRPNSIDTNMLTVGSKSQQFVLTGVILQANVDGNPNMFAASAGILSHLTIDPSQIRVWQMSAQSFTLPSTAGYYLFAKCSKSGEQGTWLLTQTQYKFEPTDDPDNYYFLVGVLSTLYPDDNFRDFQTTYGFTRINGNTITTGRIITSDGECYLDLDGNKFRIGDASSSIDWNVSRNNSITLKNVSVVSESGDVAPLGVYRGVWNANYIYYTGDEVSYTENGATCTYRYIHPTPTKGHKPTVSTYWAILAKGADGVTGNWDSFVFKQSDTKPDTPTGTKTIPDGWNDAPTANGKWWMSKATINGVTQKAGTWSEPIQVTAEDGVDGKYIDFKYRVYSFDSAPDIQKAQRNPLNWHNEPPQIESGMALWMSQAEIDANDNIVAEWSDPVRISGEKGEKGDKGDNADWMSFVFKQSETKPEKPIGINPVPDGWCDAPTANGKWWMSKATINGVTGKADEWSDPVQTTAEDGIDGPYTDFKYCKNNSELTAPTINKRDRMPLGWSDEPPTLGKGEYLWMSQAEISADNSLKSEWSNPVRISGEKGNDGLNGDGNRLVYRYAFDKPERPNSTDLTPLGWCDTPDREDFEVTHGDVWLLQNGYYTSPAINHSGITINRISFTTTMPNQMLAIELCVDSEERFDFALVGKLDTEGLSRTANYTDRISGPNTKKMLYIPIPTAGTHFIDIAYAKDGSTSKYSDCGRYRIVLAPNCWLSVGIVKGSTSKVLSWSEPIPFAIDTPDIERIYRLMEYETTPSTPDSDMYADDYVPQLSTHVHVVGETHKQGDVVIGANGNFFECTVASTTSTPVSKQGDFWIVSTDWVHVKGWTDNPCDVTKTFRYQYESVRKKKDGKWGEFSTPVLWMVLPLNGSKGDSGNYTEYRYAKSDLRNSYNPNSNPFNATGATSPGNTWVTSIPTVRKLEYLWMTMGKKNGNTNQLIGTWSTPIRVNPYDGEDGKNGDPGPAMVFRGVYSPSKTYIGSPERVDVVIYQNHYYVAGVAAGTFSNVLPSTSSDKWNDFGAEFESIATGFLLAENANIANFIFRNERLESQTQNTDGMPNIFIDGKNGMGWFTGSIVNPFTKITKSNIDKYITRKYDGSQYYGYIDLEKAGLKIMLELTASDYYAALGDDCIAIMPPIDVKYAGVELEIYNASNDDFALTGPLINILWENYTPPGSASSKGLMPRGYYRYRCMPLPKSKYYSTLKNHYSLRGNYYMFWILTDEKVL